MTNPFTRRASSLSGPGIDYLPVTPNDGADLPVVAASLYVETGGTIKFDSVKGQTRTVTVPDFGWLICGVTRVHASDTTAQNIHAVVVS
ncbi:MAG: hypothetical protein AAGE76_01985 [Pseudomonadota bacterium]